MLHLPLNLEEYRKQHFSIYGRNKSWLSFSCPTLSGKSLLMHSSFDSNRYHFFRFIMFNFYCIVFFVFCFFLSKMMDNSIFQDKLFYGSFLSFPTSIFYLLFNCNVFVYFFAVECTSDFSRLRSLDL